ncbi:hypothetical protein [Gordonia sp. CNJ-863]|uniref:hypothetical protein n=1 Tax=Gordonia sp. CNJ-863 TaxID=1904963 RepID=UPI000DB27256|nr:hypothetical protein [Gordonia sp. CNJ-863]PZT97032.1 MAG: hypothetical protein DI630_22575 [Gordonia sp. (in: high G+C Gram-positive bacteria)]
MKKDRTIQRFGAGCAAAAIGVAALLGGTGGASAATVTGWVGPAGTTGYLHTSTIINAPDLTAQSKIYHSFGQSSPDGKLGVRPRLFKSGALCQASDYQYNFYTATELTAGTENTCGSGSYNSHGFVALWNASTNTYNEYVTFPSNPLNWTDPAASSARSAPTTITDADRKSGVNARGQKFGSAATADADEQADLDLILAIGNDGAVGFVKTADLNKAPAANPESAKRAAGQRDIALWNREGNQRIGTFSIR